MSQNSGTIWQREQDPPEKKDIPSEPIEFQFEVNESWVGIIPQLCILGFLGFLVIITWIVSLGVFPSILNFEKQIIEFSGISLNVDVIQKTNFVFSIVFFILLLISAMWVFNFWRYEILGEWKFNKTGLEITGNYPTLGSEFIEYEYLKTIVTYKRQMYNFLIPGLGELASLYMFWKYRLSIIEVRAELSYLDNKGEHRPSFSIDYVENGNVVSEQIRSILKALKDKEKGFHGLPPGLFRMRR